MRLTMERADLAGVVQRSQLVYMLLHDCLPEAESAFQGLFLEVYYVCLGSQFQQFNEDLNKMLGSILC